ncbi:unnamed protein product [Lathyrus oleraceus]
MSIVLPSNLPHEINAPSPITLPDELIAEVLSLLNVKSLTRLKCVSKSWNSIISDPVFVKIHLHKSSRNPHIILFPSDVINNSVFVLPISLLQKPSFYFFNYESEYHSMKLPHRHRVIGSCNGLICLLNSRGNEFYLWNPATNPFYENLGSFPLHFQYSNFFYKFSFGYDNLTNKYKLVTFSSKEVRVRVFTFGPNIWKNIPCFSIYPYDSETNEGVYLNNTLNWFAFLNNNPYCYQNLNFEQFAVISLDLGTETYREFPFPREFDEVPSFPPIVCVLMDCLCFSHYTKEHSFIIGQMKEFGVEKSWTKLLKFDFHSIFECYKLVHLLPFYMFENGDILILERNAGQVIRYDRRDNRVVIKTIHTNNNIYLTSVVPYVESLVSTF